MSTSRNLVPTPRHPHLPTTASTDDPIQELQPLRRVSPEDPHPSVPIPASTGGLHPLLHIPLPPADTQCHPAGRSAAGPATVRLRSTALRVVVPSPAPDDHLHGLQVLAPILVVAIADQKQTRSEAGQQFLGALLTRLQRLRGAQAFPSSVAALGRSETPPARPRVPMPVGHSSYRSAFGQTYALFTPRSNPAVDRRRGGDEPRGCVSPAGMM